MFDQKCIEYELWRAHGIRTVRKTLAEIHAEAALGKAGALVFPGFQVLLIFFSTAYLCTLPPSFTGKLFFFASGVLLIGRQQLRTSVLATAPATTRTRRRGLHDSLSRTRWPSNVRPSATNSSAARRSSKSWLILVLLKGLLALPFPQSFAIIDSNLSPSQSSFGPSYMQSL